MSEPEAERRRLLHPLDLLVLVLAVVLAVIAYAYLFRSSPVSRPADVLLDAEITLEYEADRPWKRAFPAKGAAVLLEEFLQLVALDSPQPVKGRPGVVRVTVRVLGRDLQKPEALTHFRGGVRKGSQVRLADQDSEVTAEVVSVELAGDGE